jgi:hypothetical protein
VKRLRAAAELARDRVESPKEIRVTDDDLARGGHEFLRRVRTVLRAREP